MKAQFFLFIAILFMLSYQSYGQGWLWANGAVGGSSDGWPVAVDGAGNVFIGAANGWGTDMFFGTYDLPFSGPSQCVIAKYDASGNFLWAEGSQNSNGWLTNITTDGGGNIYVLGCFNFSNFTFGGTTIYNSSPAFTQGFIAKVDANGNLIWIRKCGNALNYSGSGNAIICSAGNLTADASGNCFIVVNYKSPVDTVGDSVFYNHDQVQSSNDIMIAKVSPSGDFIWSHSYGGNHDDIGLGITVTPSGSVYVAGMFNSTDFSLGDSILISSYGTMSNSPFIARFDGNGYPLWACNAGGGGADFAIGINSDLNNNVYVSGGYTADLVVNGSTVAYPGTGVITPKACFLLKLNNTNNVDWYKTINSPDGSGEVWSYSIATSPCGAVWIAGDCKANMIEIEGHDTMPPQLAPGYDPVFIAGYTSSGALVNYTFLSSGADDQIDITCDDVGNVFIVGDYKGDSIMIGNTMLRDSIPVIGNVENMYVAKYASVNVYTSDTIYQHSDTAICMNSGLSLHAPQGYTNYTWYDGSTDSAHSINNYGTYWVTAHGNCIIPTIIDTFHVLYKRSSDSVTAHSDSLICAGQQSITLNSGLATDTVLWNTGNTGASINVNSTGTYWCVAYGSCSSPIYIDTFHVASKAFSFSLGNDTVICEPVILSVPVNNAAYLWQDGSHEQTYTVNSTGSYIATATYNGCYYTDSVYINYPNLVQHLRDTSICREDNSVLQLTANVPPGANVLWSTGSNEQSIYINDSGTYSVKVYDATCADSGEMQLQYIKCDCWAEVPNAFTPNNDNKNDFFIPLLEPDCDIHDYKFAIYNRYGQVVFKTTDPKSSWDGKFNGVNCDIDTYMYLLEYKAGTKQTRHLKKGDVTLIR